jgi:hypothetical protein
VQLAPATVRHPGLAYACYRVKLAERRIEQDGCGPAEEGDGGMAIHPPQARHAARSLALGDQLGVLRMESRAAREICLPSQVILPPA